MNQDAKFLKVDRLTTTFPGNDGDIRVVNDVSFSLDPHEALGIVGESGSGKSMLMRSVMGLLPPGAQIDEESRVEFNGTDLTKLDRKRLQRLWGAQIGMIFQDPMTSLNPVRTIGQQITDPMRVHLGISLREARARAEELLALVGLSEARLRLAQYPHELSGGMRQRVMIAIALSCSPPLLIADEPTTALDVSIQKEILDLLDRLRQELSMALILISHDLGVVSGRTDRTLVMYAGKVVEFGSTSRLFAEARHPYTTDLMRATPSLKHPARTPTPAIPGLPPNLSDLPPGCSYAPRCKLRREDCVENIPVLSSAPGYENRGWACFHPVKHDAMSQLTGRADE